MLSWVTNQNLYVYLAVFVFIVCIMWLMFGTRKRQYEFVGLKPLIDEYEQHNNTNKTSSSNREILYRLGVYDDDNSPSSEETDESSEETDESSNETDSADECRLNPGVKNEHIINTLQPIYQDRNIKFRDKELIICEDKFQPDVSTTTPCSRKIRTDSKGETLCRQIFERIYQKPFPNTRPDFLRNPETGRNLELDGYNEDLRIAFEFNGIQHYQYPNWIHKTKEACLGQIKRDQFKIKKCNDIGIYLITIPYDVPYNQLEEYITARLPPTM